MECLPKPGFLIFLLPVTSRLPCLQVYDAECFPKPGFSTSFVELSDKRTTFDQYKRLVGKWHGVMLVSGSFGGLSRQAICHVLGPGPHQFLRMLLVTSRLWKKIRVPSRGMRLWKRPLDFRGLTTLPCNILTPLHPKLLLNCLVWCPFCLPILPLLTC